MAKRDYTTAQFIKAIKGSGGIITTIAKRIGCDRHTADNFIKAHPTVLAVWTDEKEAILDMAEGTLLKNIQAGDSADSKWYLTKRGKHRGYEESKEIIGTIWFSADEAASATSVRQCQRHRRRVDCRHAARGKRRSERVARLHCTAK